MTPFVQGWAFHYPAWEYAWTEDSFPPARRGFPGEMYPVTMFDFHSLFVTHCSLLENLVSLDYKMDNTEL